MHPFDFIGCVQDFFKVALRKMRTARNQDLTTDRRTAQQHGRQDAVNLARDRGIAQQHGCQDVVNRKPTDYTLWEAPRVLSGAFRSASCPTVRTFNALRTLHSSKLMASPRARIGKRLSRGLR